MLETSDLTFIYPSEALHFPELSCSAGKVGLITGISGTGKTTLLHLIGGLLRPDSGKIFPTHCVKGTGNTGTG